jgi:hypothetical protein
MITLDHLIVHVENQALSGQFYRDILAFHPESRVDPLEIIRVNPGLTPNLMQSHPKAQAHFAFNVDRRTFDVVLKRLHDHDIPFGGDVFERDGKIPANAFGGRGLAESFYFYYPDRHNLELRVHGGPP